MQCQAKATLRSEVDAQPRVQPDPPFGAVHSWRAPVATGRLTRALGVGHTAMIRDRETAQRVLDELFDVSSRLDRSVSAVRDSCSESELISYRRAVGNVLGEMWDGFSSRSFPRILISRRLSCGSPIPTDPHNEFRAPGSYRRATGALG